MRILYIGCVELSYLLLEKLIENHADICGVVTCSSSSINSDFKDLTSLCDGVPTLVLEKNNHEKILEFANEVQPDVIYCFGWSFLLKSELLKLPPLGVVGYHPAALPANRGRHPLIWALALGLKKSASTFFLLDEGVDSGDIISQVEFEISETDNARSVYNKIIEISVGQVTQFTEELDSGICKPIKQDHSLANSWRKRGQLDGQIDFRMGKEAIYNLVRALTRPYVGAHINVGGSSIPVWNVEKVQSNLNNIEPGKVLEVNGREFTVKCYDGAIKIKEHGFSQIPDVGEYL